MAMGLSNRLTYPRRLFLWLLGYSVLLVGCFVIFQYKREKEFKAEEFNNRLQLINTYILTELREGHAPSEIDLSGSEGFDDMRISVIDRAGKIVYDTSLDQLPPASHLDRQEIREALTKGSGYSVRRHSASTGDYYFYSATRGNDGYVVRTAVPYSISLTALLRADFRFLWIMGVISVVMCILGYFATRRVGQHILRLKQFADNVEKGRKISETEPFPNDELGSISNNIVRLYARLQQANVDRDHEHRSALHEQQEKERIKKQLTNNINHELKTPVASIRICVETLLAHKDMSEEKRELFLNRCLSNTDRLQHLLADVALITRMDDGCGSIVKESVDLSDIIRGVVEDRRIIAESKGIAIRNGISCPLILEGNVSLLEAVFNNLIDNAIAYSGGSNIDIGLETETSGKIVLTFEDDGIGVSSEHLERLFERFYRIDKGRSRAAGGTGLGLAIVKNAVIIHGGTIVAENRLSGGLRFRITLLRRE